MVKSAKQALIKHTSRKISGKFKSSASKANAAGYEKRRARKEKSNQLNSSDVYEYLPEKARRSKLGLDLDRDEAISFGTGLDDDENNADHGNGELRARLIGADEDDERIDSADDEEIDSDAAFEESDEERFAGFFSEKSKPSHKSKPQVRFADVDLNEDEAPSDDEEEEQVEQSGDEFIDLLDVLDGKGDIDMGSDDELANSKPRDERPMKEIPNGNDDEESSYGGSDEEESAEDDDGDDTENDTVHAASKEYSPIPIAPSDDEESPEALEELQNFISNLDPMSKKRKTPGDAASIPDTRSRKRRIMEERTEAGVENEFRAHSLSAKLNLDDLLAPLASKSSTLQSLKKSVKVLAPTSSASKTKTLPAPLPHRTQERLDRQAAYEQTKEEVNKWSSTMKRIREAEHLSFPLQVPKVERVSNLELAAKFKPTTELESAVDALLKTAKLREEDIHDTEEMMLQANKLSVEEVAARRNELRKMRELMFRAEVKARRMNKIKSKAYRRIKRKEKEKLAEKIDENEEGGGEEVLKHELERARERATLKHKHTGKWAKQMKGRELDEDSRRDIEDMLARGEKLRRRIRGVGSDSSDGEDDDSEDEGNGSGENDIEKVRQDAFDELKQLELADQNLGIRQMHGRGVFEMKFMKNAMARSQQAADKLADDFIQEMGSICDQPDDNGSVVETRQVDPSSGFVAQRAGGRIVYRPGTDVNQMTVLRPLGSLASDTSSVTLKSTDLLSPPPPSPKVSKQPSTFAPPAETTNPWLAFHGSDGTPKAPKMTNEVVIGKDSKAAEKSKNKLRKQARKRDEEREMARDDATMEISTENVLTAPSELSNGAEKPKLGAGNDVNGDDSDVDSEVEAQEQNLEMLKKGKGKIKGSAAFKQRDLVALAFAGDNVVQEFEAAKRREIAEDAPREVDTTIPGWGSWGGIGTRRLPPKPQRIKKIAGIDPTTRADYNKKNIIISEKRDKKAAKYLVKDLPYPYTSKAQFERTMEQPLGTEWNTRVAFQRGTLPKVVKKPGVVINPLEKLT